ncbi:hypothetical protein RJ639_024680 [Escallonia herrerae]|uniref:BCCIP-like protein n=1 Tax=Escallonia herrerae TaxID=1293975 RepID=A0AA88V1G5_9ASTE|nr:hypothetical protein RJ639_024680 [Escallonia herrerae]
MLMEKGKRRGMRICRLEMRNIKWVVTHGNGFENHASDENSEQAESTDEDFDGVVQADFAFFDPKSSDFHGVKILLQTYLDEKQWDDHKCIAEIKDFLRKSCKEEDMMNNLRSYLGEQAQDVGLLISQRVVNLPPQLLPPMYDALFDEVSWATEDEPTEELRNSFCFKYYLLISRIYKHKTADQQKRQKSDEATVYVKPEDEIFHKLSSWSFSFHLRTQQLVPHEARNGFPSLPFYGGESKTDVDSGEEGVGKLQPSSPPVTELKDYRLMGLVMAVEASKVSAFRGQLKSLIDEP